MRAVGELLSYRALDVALILVDEEALDACGRRLSDRIRERFLAVPIVLLSRRDSRWPAGFWDAILSGPKTISEIAARLVELAAHAVRQPILAFA